MNALELAKRIARSLVEEQLDYAIGGALALGVWGAIRMTKDVDLSIFVPIEQLPRAFDALERAGVMVQREQATRDVVDLGMFHGRYGRMAVDAFVSRHPQAAAMRDRRRTIDAGGDSLVFISAEDLCLHKLIYGRPKDLIDLERLFATHQPMDVEYIRSWLQKMVPAGDRRLPILEDLVGRFTGTA